MAVRRLPPLSALRAFEAAARHRSFKDAADELAVTPTAISHQVKSLEEHLGVRLFERRTRQVALTLEGDALFPVLRDGFDAFAAGVQQVTASRARPAVTVSATRAFTARWLVPRVTRFQAAHPDISLQLQASDDVVDLHAEQVDLAVRYGPGPYSGLRADTLFVDRFAPLASPNLNLSTPDDLHRAPLIHFDWRRADPVNPTWSRWFKMAGLAAPEVAAELRFSEESHAIQAAVAGHGVGMLSLVLVQEEIALGLLVQPFGPTIEGFTYRLVEAPDRRKSEHVDAVRAWLVSESGSDA